MMDDRVANDAIPLAVEAGFRVPIKLCAFGALLALGAVHRFWLMPKIDALRDAGDDRSGVTILAEHFRTVIVLEVILGIGVLFIVPFLSGSARNQALQAKAADLSQTRTVGGQRITVTPAGLQPGLTDYQVSISNPAVTGVSMQFASPTLGVPAQDVPASQTGPGQFGVSGMYTPIVGSWQLRVIPSTHTEAGTSAIFVLPVRASGKLPKSSPPKIRWTTWAWGVGEALLVGLALAASTALSRLLSARRAALADVVLRENEWRRCMTHQA
jgi:hypothetical protein